MNYMRSIAIIKIGIITIAASLATGVIAEEASNKQVVAKISTMGLGVEYTHPINSVLSVGFGVNKFSTDRSFTEDDIRDDGDIDFSSLAVIANYHPWESGFRLRFGVYYNNNEVDLSASGNDFDNIGADDFTGADITLNGNLSFKEFAPYIGIGYGSKPIGDNNFAVDFDIGVMRSPIEVRLSGTCEGITRCNDGTFETELENERTNLEDDVDNLDFYPVVSLGISYRF